MESDWEGDKVAQAFIGIGLNINQTLFDEMSRRPTSMSLVCGKNFNIEEVKDSIVAKFIEYYTRITQGEQKALFEEYEKSLMGYNTPLLYRDANGEFSATVHGVLNDGRIVLKCDDGTLRNYWFKEVESVILGY